MGKLKKYKISRRLQFPVFEKCQTQKFQLREQRRTPKRRRGPMSEFGKQLIEKQKLRFLYGISEKSLKNYVNKATSTKGVSTEEYLGELLERRLDNVVYRLGLGSTRLMSRQMATHGHFLINGRKIDIPSYQVKDSDVISIREGSKNTKMINIIFEKGSVSPKADWVEWNAKTGEGKLTGKPAIDEGLLKLTIVLEYYSR